MCSDEVDAAYLSEELQSFTDDGKAHGARGEGEGVVGVFGTGVHVPQFEGCHQKQRGNDEGTQMGGHQQCSNAGDCSLNNTAKWKRKIRVEKD